MHTVCIKDRLLGAAGQVLGSWQTGSLETNYCTVLHTGSLAMTQCAQRFTATEHAATGACLGGHEAAGARRQARAVYAAQRRGELHQVRPQLLLGGGVAHQALLGRQAGREGRGRVG